MVAPAVAVLDAQPTLVGELVTVRPLRPDDREALCAEAQGLVVATNVDTLSNPRLLLDSPSSRTLRLFADRVRPERKSPAANETFPADDPLREIDYVFASEGTSWEVREIPVVADSVTSDHRPVVATVRRRGI